MTGLSFVSTYSISTAQLKLAVDFRPDIVLIARMASERNGEERQRRIVLVGNVKHQVVGRGLGGGEAEIEAETVFFAGDGEFAAGPLIITAHGPGLAVFSNAEHVERGRIVSIKIALFDTDALSLTNG